MKALIEKKFAGNDVGTVGIYVDGPDLVQQARFPLAKIIEPATNGVDKLLDKLEAAIPGDWDKPLIEKLKQEYKEELISLIGGTASPVPTPAE